jgi:type II secretory pathway pseudopilin PulG
MKISFRKSFSLIELMVAIFILVVGIVSLLQAFPLGTYIESSSQMNSVANQLAQEKMEEINSQSYDSTFVGTAEENYGSIASFTAYKRSTTISYFDPGNPEVASGSDLGIKKMEVTVFWHSSLGPAEKQVQITSLMVKR